MGRIWKLLDIIRDSDGIPIKVAFEHNKDGKRFEFNNTLSHKLCLIQKLTVTDIEKKPNVIYRRPKYKSYMNSIYRAASAILQRNSEELKLQRSKQLMLFDDKYLRKLDFFHQQIKYLKSISKFNNTVDSEPPYDYTDGQGGVL